jgi:hypothetical protein
MVYSNYLSQNFSKIKTISYKSLYFLISGTIVNILSKFIISVGDIVHTCNSSYSGGRDGEDCSLRPALEKS